MTVFIRVDSGEAIGSGHVMRCLTLADQLLDKSSTEDIIFLSRPHLKNSIQIIEDRGYKVHRLSAPLSSPITDDEGSWLAVPTKKDAEEVKNIISSYKVRKKTLIIDHYSIDIEWQKIVRISVSDIIVIDDLANRIHDCDLLLDQNYYLDQNTRYGDLLPSETQCFFGPEYALLRPDFYEYRKKRGFSKNIHDLFIFFGGIDLQSMTLKVLKTLEKKMDIRLHVVVNRHFPDYASIKALASKYDHIIIYEDVKNMAQLMSRCDAAIGAGGTAQWERLCLALPSIVFSVAANQKQVCYDMSYAGFYHYAGDISDMSDNTIKTEIISFMHDAELRKGFFQKANDLTFKPIVQEITQPSRSKYETT